MKKINLSLLIFLFAIIGKSNGQTSIPTITDFNQLNKILPPPPNAAALGKYGGLNVGLSTGSINVSIPLYDFKSRNINVPLSLNYVTNGVKVDEIGSRVGMTWALNVGGVITTTVYGKPDESSARPTPPNINTPSYDLINYISKLSDFAFPQQDGQYDIFTFNFNGISGRFTSDTLNYTDNSKPVLLDYSDLKISKSTGVGSSFVITTNDGTRYYFFGGKCSGTKRNKSFLSM